MCMKCQSLFSGKNEKNIINLSPAEFTQKVAKVIAIQTDPKRKKIYLIYLIRTSIVQLNMRDCANRLGYSAYAVSVLQTYLYHPYGYPNWRWSFIRMWSGLVWSFSPDWFSCPMHHMIWLLSWLFANIKDQDTTPFLQSAVVLGLVKTYWHCSTLEDKDEGYYYSVLFDW